MATSLMPSVRSTPQWLHYAVPVACLSTSLAIYANRRTLLSWAYEFVAKVSRPNIAGKAYLSGNYAPVDDELFSEDLQLVEGSLPDGLDGCYVRTGPNPFFKPLAGYHWFDGDGMLHAVRLSGGRAAYCNRYVDTDRLQQERAAGRPLFLRLGDLFGLRGLILLMLNNLGTALGAVRVSEGDGTANTALVFHAGRLLALNEGDLPYAVRVLCSGLVETMGRLKIGKTWRNKFTAHPKRDPANGELLFIGYQFNTQPYVSAGVLDEGGNLTRHWGVQLPRPVMMHDMAATEHYLVLLDLPLCFDPQAMVKENTVPFKLRRDVPSRIGLLRREQPSNPGGADVQWFEMAGPGFMAFHVANAWEDSNGDVKVFACQQDYINMDLDQLDSRELACLTEYTLTPATGVASARRLSEVKCDFPVVHPGKATRPCRFSWIAIIESDGSAPCFMGIVKMDLTAAPGSDACVGRIDYPAGTFGGEAVFVPRSAQGTAEDDGYLVVYVYESKTGTSYMNVYDACTMAAKPVASLRMPRRVPYGFHGTWVSEAQLKQQAMFV